MWLEHCCPGNMWLGIVIQATCGWALLSRQHVAGHCYPGNMWLNIVVQATCGWALLSRQHVAEHCYLGNMWLSIVIQATCGWALLSRQHVAEALLSRQHVAGHCYPGNMWLNIVVQATCGWALLSRQHVAEHCYLGNMWLSIVIQATCGWALLSRQHVAEHCCPGNMWLGIVIQATCGWALLSRQYVAEDCHEAKLWPTSLSKCITCFPSSWFGAYNFQNQILEKVINKTKVKEPVCPTIFWQRTKWVHAFGKSISMKWNLNSLIQINNLNNSCDDNDSSQNYRTYLKHTKKINSLKKGPFTSFSISSFSSHFSSSFWQSTIMYVSWSENITNSCLEGMDITQILHSTRLKVEESCIQTNRIIHESFRIPF